MKTSKSLVTVAIVLSFAFTACGGGGGGVTAPVTSGTSTAPVSSTLPVATPVTPVIPTTTVTVSSVNGLRSFTVPLATKIGSAVDTSPSDITGEASLALWPMVAGVKAYEDVAGKLTADQFPKGIWPIYFKYTKKTTSDRLDPTGGASSSNFACSLDLVAGALVATVDGRTFSAPTDDLPTYIAGSFGTPEKGDGYRLIISPAQTAYYELATKRSIEMKAEAQNNYVHPTYGSMNAGPSLSLRARYDGFVAGIPAGSTKLFIYSVSTQTGWFTQYLCEDQLI